MKVVVVGGGKAGLLVAIELFRKANCTVLEF